MSNSSEMSCFVKINFNLFLDSNWILYSIEDGRKVYICMDAKGRTSTTSDNKTLSFKSSITVHGQADEVSEFLRFHN